MKCDLGIARINCDYLFGCANCDHYVAEEGEILVFDLDKVREMFKRYSNEGDE